MCLSTTSSKGVSSMGWADIKQCLYLFSRRHFSFYILLHLLLHKPYCLYLWPLKALSGQTHAHCNSYNFLQKSRACTASSCCCSVPGLDENDTLRCWDNMLALPPQSGMSLLKVMSWDGGCPQKQPVPSWEVAQTSALCNRSASLQCTAGAELGTTWSISFTPAGHMLAQNHGWGDSAEPWQNVAAGPHQSQNKSAAPTDDQQDCLGLALVVRGLLGN